MIEIPIIMIVSTLRPGASACTTARWPRYAQLKANALVPHGGPKGDEAVRRSCGVYTHTISMSDGQTVRRSHGETVIRTDDQRVRRSDDETARRSKGI